MTFQEQQSRPDEFVQRHGENNNDDDDDDDDSINNINNHQYIHRERVRPYHHHHEFDFSRRRRIGDGDGDDEVAFKRELIMNPQEHLRLYHHDDDDDDDGDDHMETDVAIRGDNTTFTSQRNNIEDSDHVAFKREQVMNPQDHLHMYRDSPNEQQHNDNPLLWQQQEQQYNTEYAAIPSEYVCPVNSHLHTIAPYDTLADTSGVQSSDHGGRHDHSATGILVLPAATPLTVPAAPFSPSNSTLPPPAEISSSHDTTNHSNEEDGSSVNNSSPQHYSSSKKRQSNKFRSFFQRFRRSATR